MDMLLLVLKTFQTVHCNDEIPLSHNSLWPGCIIGDYSSILGQQTVLKRLRDVSLLKEEENLIPLLSQEKEKMD